MIDSLLQFAVSNVCVSIVLASLAFAVHRTGRFPVVAHLLWVVVLIALVTPPLLTVPMVPIPASESSALATPTDAAALSTEFKVAAAESANATTDLAVNAEADANVTSAIAWLMRSWASVVLGMWLAGTLVVLAVSLLRIMRFNELLASASRPAAADLRSVAQEVSGHLGLRRVPSIVVTAARLSPMVWWMGGPVRVVIPEELLRSLERTQLRWVIAHELAHVARRDHLVRWLEWLACVVFWWNPIAWWARRNVRINEEICCDALVLNMLQPEPRGYADSLMSVVEFLASPVIRPPAVASEINSGGILEKRFNMIIATNRTMHTPRWLRACVMMLALGLVPLGVTYAQDVEAVGQRLRDAVANGELSPAQARVMMDALQRSTASETQVAAQRRVEKLEDLVHRGELSREEAAVLIERVHRVMEEHARDTALKHDREAEIKHRIEEIKRLVNRGEMSRKEAAKLMEDLHGDLAEHDQGNANAHERRLKQEYVRAETELKKLIADGRISAEDTKARLIALRKEMVARHERERRVAYERRLAEIKRLVDRGEMSREEAQHSILELERANKPSVHSEHDRALEAYRRAEAEFDEMVAAGKVSPEDAEARLIAMRRELATARGPEGEHEMQRITREQYAEVEKELRHLIAEGEISIEDAANKLEDMRRMMAERRPHEESDWDAIKTRIERAVKEGEMSREEADEIYRKMKEEKKQQEQQIIKRRR